MNEEELLKLIKKFPKIKFEKILHSIFFDSPEDKDFHYTISGFEGNPEVTFSISSDKRISILKEILPVNFEFIPEFLAIKKTDLIEVACRAINPRSSFWLRRKLEKNPFICFFDYYSNQLELTIVKKDTKTTLSNILQLKGSVSSQYIIQIKGLIKKNEEQFSEDLRKILNCFLFDLTYNYQISLEPISFETLRRRSPNRKKRINLPDTPVKIIYKEYIAELIEYFYIGDKVDYAPFRFICYFHIIEYFSDKSAYFLAAKKLKSLMLKPDFHINTDKYVSSAINFFKLESTKFTGDKVKIKRVLNQFIDKDELEEYLKEIDLLDYFKENITIKCSKDLNLPGLKFESNSKFEESLTKRIYSMRCSIVHSNPDFDESKAIPFKPTAENMNILRKENEMMFAIARQIILESKQ